MTIKLNEEQSLDLVKSTCSPSQAHRRSKIFELESKIVHMRDNLDGVQVDIPVEESFHGGMYLRKIAIPKGTLATGAIHKFNHYDIMISGDITVSTDTDQPKRLSGFNFMEGEKGKKRAGYAHEDTHWITIHSLDELPGVDMAAFLTCKTFEELEEFELLLSSAVEQISHDEKIITEHALKLCSGGNL